MAAMAVETAVEASPAGMARSLSKYMEADAGNGAAAARNPACCRALAENTASAAIFHRWADPSGCSLPAPDARPRPHPPPQMPKTPRPTCTRCTSCGSAS